MNSRSGRMVIGLTLGMAAVIGIGFAIKAMAESEKINPVEVVTRRVHVYGTNPFKLGSTEVTEANIIAIQAGGTLPAVNGAALTALNGANIASGNIALARLTNALVVGTGVTITNTCIAADGKTNTYVFMTLGTGAYTLKSITTTP